MQIDWFTFVAQIVNFLILIALLQRFLYKPVIKAMDEREQKISAELEDARLKKIEAEEKERHLEEELQDFDAQKNHMLEEAKNEANHQKKEWMQKLREEVAETRKRWVETIESEKESFLTELKKETGNKIIVLAEDILRDLSERNLQQQMSDFFMEQLQQLDDKHQLELQKAIDQQASDRAQVISSFELSGEQRHQIIDLLNQASGTELEYSFKTSEDLGFGLQAKIGGWRLGWNLENYLENLETEMERHIDEQKPIYEAGVTNDNE
jgi:F-type H+-transporting ATPase subunit b